MYRSVENTEGKADLWRIDSIEVSTGLELDKRRWKKKKKFYHGNKFDVYIT